ncbi:carbonic anhydrase [Streptomyces sp. NBC_01142]|uniref:carbonic anhydrase n=1 Tax=Streptomyces sp. NBC_01142 TaxID=2975865 RepID=UPI002259845F|nr:carbonic anhydrase [Streptomyces sp. NBC_01142]MCX4821275.1 carbonic anhydrase [Streptomyces sp. NBC_01142]
MKALLARARSFRRRVDFESHTYRKLADGQFPQALFIACSDSRVIPALITGARPGDIFEIRNAGNIVPPYRPHLVSGEAATVEYALEVLDVRDIVVCGHSHCGAMGALSSGKDLSGLPRVGAWLEVARPGLAPVLDREPAGSADSTAESDGARITELAQLNVRVQLAALRQYPAARRRLAEGLLRLHGWYYEVDTGELWELGEDGDAFRVHAC